MAGKFPLRIVTPEEFAHLRGFLQASGYTDQALCKLFGIGRLSDLTGFLRPDHPKIFEATRGRDVLSFLARFFLAGAYVTRRELAFTCPPQVSAAIDAMGMVLQLDSDPDQVYAASLLYPIGAAFIVSDRYAGPDSQVYYQDEDLVMLGIDKITMDFAEMVPASPTERFLELGAGAGIVAMNAASSYARQAWATDITVRATRYLEFTRRLNGLENISVVRGDLFAPVAGLRFDRIAMNPPFEPDLKGGRIYAAGGADGERILRRTIESLHRVLAPGGRMYAMTLATDRAGDTFEQRIRRWLGAHSEEYDVAVFLRERMQPMEYALQSSVHEKGGMHSVTEWADFFNGIAAEHVLYGHLVVQRRAEERPVFTVRRQFGPRSAISHIEWLLEWMTLSQQGATAGWMMEAAPHMTPQAELRVRHAMRNGDLTPQEYILWTEHPFQADLQCPPWLARLASRSDGKRSGEELYQEVLSQGVLNESDPRRHFLQATDALISGGFVTIEGHQPPNT